MKLDKIKTRIARADYEVDTEAVAEAIVRRLVATRGLAGTPSTGAPGGPASAGAR